MFSVDVNLQFEATFIMHPLWSIQINETTIDGSIRFTFLQGGSSLLDGCFEGAKSTRATLDKT